MATPLMLKIGKRAEQQAFAGKGLDYVTDLFPSPNNCATLLYYDNHFRAIDDVIPYLAPEDVVKEY